MNRAHREFCKKRISEGQTPKKAYEEARNNQKLRHAVWINGALIKVFK